MHIQIHVLISAIMPINVCQLKRAAQSQSVDAIAGLDRSISSGIADVVRHKLPRRGAHVNIQCELTHVIIQCELLSCQPRVTLRSVLFTKLSGTYNR